MYGLLKSIRRGSLIKLMATTVSIIHGGGNLTDIMVIEAVKTDRACSPC